MKIRLNLEHHCIETEIKRRNEAAISDYFKDHGDKQTIESELVLLEKAQAVFDFSILRGQWPILAGGSKHPVCLAYDDDGVPCLQFDKHCITPTKKKRIVN